MHILGRIKVLFSKMQQSVTYSDKNWTDVINRYGLLNQLEIVINEKNAASVSSQNISTRNNSSWIFRSAVFAGFIAVIGNIPVQSHLIVSTIDQDKAQSFEINPSEIKIDTVAIEISTPNSEDKTFATIEKNNVSNSEELTLPERAIETYAGHVINENNSKWTTYHVKSYDNLTNIFHKLGHQGVLKALKDDKDIYGNIKHLKKGSIIRASSVEGQLDELVLTHDKKSSYVVSKKGDNYQGTWENNVFEIRQARASFTIKNGLFFDGKKAGIANNIVKQVVKVFDWDIDFSHDVRVGDKITAVFEELYHDGDKVGNQHLLAAEFINKGHEFRSIRYTYKDGKADYFTPQGREMKKAFIRTPIEHARVSSHFNPGRFHPKLHKIRAHKGTDFAARTGTPIMATGNGVIKSLGRKGGYGRTIIIQHRDGYKTTYAHMSRYKKGLKPGDKVYQGDTIGYVGRSGLATGPHLHYEFHQDKKAVNAMTVSLPNSMSLSSKELQDFRNKAINLVLQLNVLHRFVEADIEIDSAFGG